MKKTKNAFRNFYDQQPAYKRMEFLSKLREITPNQADKRNDNAAQNWRVTWSYFQIDRLPYFVIKAFNDTFPNHNIDIDNTFNNPNIITPQSLNMSLPNEKVRTHN